MITQRTHVVYFDVSQTLFSPEPMGRVKIQLDAINYPAAAAFIRALFDGPAASRCLLTARDSRDGRGEMLQARLPLALPEIEPLDSVPNVPGDVVLYVPYTETPALGICGRGDHRIRRAIVVGRVIDGEELVEEWCEAGESGVDQWFATAFGVQ